MNELISKKLIVVLVAIIAAVLMRFGVDATLAQSIADVGSIVILTVAYLFIQGNVDKEKLKQSVEKAAEQALTQVDDATLAEEAKKLVGGGEVKDGN